MPLWTLAIALTTGKNIRLFGVLDQNKIFYLRVTAWRARQPLSRRAISLGSFTGAVDFVLQLIRLESLGSELQQSYIYNNFHPVADNARHALTGSNL